MKEYLCFFRKLFLTLFRITLQNKCIFPAQHNANHKRLGRILQWYKCICSSFQHSCRKQTGRWNCNVFSWSDACEQSPGVLNFDMLPVLVAEGMCCVSDWAVLPSFPGPWGWVRRDGDCLWMSTTWLAMVLGTKGFLLQLLLARGCLLCSTGLWMKPSLTWEREQGDWTG